MASLHEEPATSLSHQRPVLVVMKNAFNENRDSNVQIARVGYLATLIGQYKTIYSATGFICFLECISGRIDVPCMPGGSYRRRFKSQLFLSIVFSWLVSWLVH